MFSLIDLIQSQPETRAVFERIGILDIGAMMIEGIKKEYSPIFDKGCATVVGFEPVSDECNRLNQTYANTGMRFLPYFIGDGTRQKFFLTNNSMTASLYEPNSELLNRFQNLGELVVPVAEEMVDTQRLDDISELDFPIDYIKIDIQEDMSSEHGMGTWHGTTILMVRKGGRVVIAGDGQVSLGPTVIKNTARKVRPLAKGSVIGGFAGATADAFTLFERLEAKLEQYPGQLMRACVELAKDWRTDRYLRRLEAMMLVADKDVSLVLTGTGDVLEPEGGVMGIGSGGNFALAAARALVDTDMEAEAIARKAMAIAADICVYTNGNLTIESLESAR